MKPVEWALALHGGAGVTRASLSVELEVQVLASLERALRLGKQMLEEGRPSLDVVETVVRFLEDDPLFNAGKGAVFTSEGKNELDAAIMDGRTRACGAVTGLTTVKNPVSLARAVMERSPHVFLSGACAEAFAAELGLERVPPEYFFVQRRYDDWRRAVEQAAKAPGHGTVGAVARDKAGNLAAATSTGGMTNKRFGRIGDVPVIGAGTFADNQTVAVSSTGIGEQFIRQTVAGDVAARMAYGGASLAAATEVQVQERLQPGDGGLIAVDRHGALALVFNSEGMHRGAADSTGRFDVAIWPDGH